jgi:iron complex outermembrane receptor protein
LAKARLQIVRAELKKSDMGVILVKKQDRGMRWWLGSVAGAAILLGMDPASAQQPAQTPATQERQTVFDIPSQDLNSALLAFADKAGLQLFYDANRVSGRKSAGVSGTLTARDALSRLLSGTGFTYRFTNATAIALEALPETRSGTTTLAPLVIEGRAQRGTGPVEGFVAKNSTAATKVDIPILETPQSISVVTAEQMQTQGSENVMQAMRYTPGAFTGQVGHSNRYDYVILRGFVDRSIDNVYLDGLKMMGDDSTYSSFQIDPYFLERVDVIRGPASVLYGRNSPGGIIAEDSKKPLFEQQNEIQGTFGTNNKYGVAFDSTGALDVNKTFAYRVTGMVEGADSMTDYARERRFVIAPSVTAKIGEDTTLVVQAYIQREPEGGTHNSMPAEGMLYPRNGQYVPRSFFDGEPGLEKFERNQHMIGYQLEHKFDENWSVRQNLRYINSDVDIDQVYQIGWAGPTTINRYYFGGEEFLNAVAVDNQLQGKFATGPLDHILVGGFDYQHRQVKNDWDYGALLTTIDVFNPVYGSDALDPATVGAMLSKRRLDQYGFYAQDQIALDHWRLSLGLRQDFVDTSIDDILAATKTTDSRQKLTKRAGLLYAFDNGLSPYVSYAESFIPSLRTDSLGKPLKPTEAAQYEVGLKYQAPGTNSIFTAAIFRIDHDNVAVRDTPASFVYHAAGSVRSQGLELEANTQLTDNFRLMAGYTYTDAKYTKSTDGNKGNTPAQIPEHMASVWGDYWFDSGLLRNLGIGAGVRYVGGIWADTENTRKVPGYTLVDMSVRYGLDDIGLPGGTARLNVNNLFDKNYVASCYDLSNCYFGAERSVTATLNYKF